MYFLYLTTCRILAQCTAFYTLTKEKIRQQLNGHMDPPASWAQLKAQCKGSPQKNCIIKRYKVDCSGFSCMVLQISWFPSQS